MIILPESVISVAMRFTESEWPTTAWFGNAEDPFDYSRYDQILPLDIPTLFIQPKRMVWPKTA